MTHFKVFFPEPRLQHNGLAQTLQSGGRGLKFRQVLGFFLLLSFPTFLHQWNLLNKVPQVAASLTVSCERNNGCLAELPGVKQAQ